MQIFRGAAPRVVALSSCDVYRACGVLHGSEPGPLQPLPLTESSDLRTNLQTYPPDRVKMLQQVFGWLDEEYDKIPVERRDSWRSRPAGHGAATPDGVRPRRSAAPALPCAQADGRSPAGNPVRGKHAAWRAPRGYVENVAAAIGLAATNDRAAGRIYNVGCARCLSELEYAHHVAAETGWSGDFVVLRPIARPRIFAGRVISTSTG